MAAVDFVVDGYFNDISDPTQFFVDINISDIDQQFVLQQLYSFQFAVGPTNWPARTFPDINSAINYLFTNLSSYFLSSVDLYRGTTGSTLGTVYRSLTPEDRQYFVRQSTTVNGHALSGNIAIAYSDLTGTPPSTAMTTSALTLTPVNPGTTTGGNTGTQISATKDSTVRVTYSTLITYSLSGSPESLVTLKKCATNDVNEANWAGCGSTATRQPTGLAVTVGQSVGAEGQVCTHVPPGWYVKAVKTGAGTHTEAQVYGEKTLYG